MGEGEPADVEPESRGRGKYLHRPSTAIEDEAIHHFVAAAAEGAPEAPTPPPAISDASRALPPTARGHVRIFATRSGLLELAVSQLSRAACPDASA
jgi:hypothetical protein